MFRLKIKTNKTNTYNSTIKIKEDSIFKPVKGFEDYYEISNYGVVRSKERIVICSDGQIKPIHSRYLKPRDNGNGYLFVYLWRDNKSYRRYVHRLVAEYFISNPDNLEEVNHINGNKSDNNLNNLEWCNRLYNEKVKTRILANYGGIKIYQIDYEGNIINTFDSIKECCRVLHHTFCTVQKLITSDKYIIRNNIKYKLRKDDNK